MNNRVNTLNSSADYGYGISQEQRHKVLRNTYWLLALSLRQRHASERSIQGRYKPDG